MISRTVTINERGVYVPKNQDCDRCLRIARPNDMHALGQLDPINGPDEWVCTDCLYGSRAPWLLK